MASEGASAGAGGSSPDVSSHKVTMELSLIKETVTITNTGSDSLSIAGWKLGSDVGSQEFTFPAGQEIPKDGSVVVCSGKDAAKTAKAAANGIVWTKQFIWNNNGDTAVLKDEDGDVVLSITETPGKADMELDLIADTVTISNIGEGELVLGGWKLGSEVGHQEYTFEDSVKLAEGASITICSGKDAAKNAEAASNGVVWTKQFIWNNNGDTAVLKDKDGNAVLTVKQGPLMPEMALDLFEDTVTISNAGIGSLNLTGWTLGSEVGSQAFSFPSGLKLAPGDDVVVCSGKDAAKHAKAAKNGIVWTKQYIWNNDGDTAVLKDPSGKVILISKETPGTPDMELDLIADTVTISNVGKGELDIGGWKLGSEVGHQEYEFDASTKIAEGSSVVVCSGKDAAKNAKAAAHGIVWTKQFIWNNNGDTAVLKDKDGNAVLTVTETPGKPAMELDLIADTVTISNIGEGTLQLGGFFLCSGVGDQEYAFEADVPVAAGSSIVVCSGKDAAKHAKAADNGIVWTKQFIWNNEGDTAVLKDKSRKTVLRVSRSPGKPSMALDLIADTVTVSNVGEDDLDIGSWTLGSEVGHQSYTFAAGTSIPAGGNLVVCSGKHAAKHAKAAANGIVWTKQYVWNNDGDTAVLRDDKGKLVLKVKEEGESASAAAPAAGAGGPAPEASAGAGGSASASARLNKAQIKAVVDNKRKRDEPDSGAAKRPTLLDAARAEVAAKSHTSANIAYMTKDAGISSAAQKAMEALNRS